MQIVVQYYSTPESTSYPHHVWEAEGRVGQLKENLGWGGGGGGETEMSPLLWMDEWV